jgi:heat shock protein HslJ
MPAMSPALRGLLACVVCVGLASIGLAACDEGPTAPTSVTDITWELQRIDGGPGSSTAIPSPDRFTLRLGADGMASVRSDCNTCVGRYTLDGSSVSMPALACTKAFCGTGLDQTYAEALSQARTMATSSDELVLRGPTSSLFFRRR